jgi:hypothetical protein
MDQLDSTGLQRRSKSFRLWIGEGLAARSHEFLEVSPNLGW